MSWKQKLLHEFRAVSLAALFFGLWLAVLMIIKQLILAEYQIEFSGLTKAIIGALILSKVVLVLERVSLGEWVRRQPAWVDILLRTAVYALGVVAVLMLEKGFDGREEYGGFLAAVAGSYAAEDAYPVLRGTGASMHNAPSHKKAPLSRGFFMGWCSSRSEASI